jgi:hypothetical protein
MVGKAIAGAVGSRSNGMPPRGESSQSLLGGGGGPGRKTVSLLFLADRGIQCFRVIGIGTIKDHAGLPACTGTSCVAGG